MERRPSIVKWNMSLLFNVFPVENMQVDGGDLITGITVSEIIVIINLDLLL
jgi:hypothetical protein